jgi:murein DD-endopeptidase MepM/ murein hydrolase activator NlpD
VDFAVRTGSPVIAPTKGRVRNWSNASAGNAVDFYHIDDNGQETGFYDQFMHLSRFVTPGVYEPGATIGFSGNTGSSTGPHIHWDLVNPQGRVVRQWEYFREDPIVIGDDEMKYVGDASRLRTYLVGAEYICWVSGAEAPHVAHQFGPAKMHGKTSELELFCRAMGIPDAAFKALNELPDGGIWSKVDTISGGGGATPAQIAAAVDASLKDDFAGIPKNVNDDVAKRMSS